MGSGPRGVNTPEIVIQRMSNIPRGVFVIGIVAVLAVVLLFNAFYQLEPEEQGIILRFGKFTGDVYEPGLHMKIPFVDELYKVPTRRQLKMEFGFRTAAAGQRTRYEARDFPEESIMLTGDLNVADVEWIVQYKIGDPYLYKFKVYEVEKTFSDMSEAVMRQIVGDHSVDEVITIGRTKIAGDAKLLLQELCDRYETGIRVDQVVLQDVNPPKPVQPSFNEVNESIQERERSINQAWAEYNKVVPRTRGEAEQTIRQAEGYALERVNNAEGDATRFLALYEEYRKAPDVTRRRLYLETVERVLPALGDKVIVDDDLENLLPLLNLGGAAGLPSAGAKGGER